MSIAEPPDEAPTEQPRQRKIIHVDMDAFFASVEQRDNPELRGKPVAVGGSSGRGVVAAASYEARRFGVKSAMPSVTAKRLCPDLIFVKSRFDAYREASEQIRAIFRHHTDLVEPLSLDEAYLDVTENNLGIPSATQVAQMIRQEIRAKTRLTASAGVSYNKFLAKLASDQNKPDGICVIRPGEGATFVQTLPIRRFHGVGPRGEEKMARLGIATGADLAAKDAAWLAQHFGSFGEYLYRAARGMDDRPVRSNRIRKSVGRPARGGRAAHHARRDRRDRVGADRASAGARAHRDAQAQIQRLPADDPRAFAAPQCRGQGAIRRDRARDPRRPAAAAAPDPADGADAVQPRTR